MSARGSVYAVVPVKDPAFGKTRLAPVLNARERHALCLYLAKRTLEVCAAAFGAERTIVVTASPEIAQLATQARLLVVPEAASADSLNAAISLGAARARQAGAEVLLVVPADLALLSVAELQAAVDAIPAAPGCLIVPDRRHSGTNLLGLAPLREDLFAFGEQSLQRHTRLAARAGCEVCIHRSAALGLDLDLPEDYFEWRQTNAEAASALANYPAHAGSMSA